MERIRLLIIAKSSPVGAVRSIITEFSSSSLVGKSTELETALAGNVVEAHKQMKLWAGSSYAIVAANSLSFSGAEDTASANELIGNMFAALAGKLGISYVRFDEGLKPLKQSLWPALLSAAASQLPKK